MNKTKNRLQQLESDFKLTEKHMDCIYDKLDKLDGLDKTVDSIKNDCKEIRDYISADIKLIRDYNKAVAFLNWFDFNALESSKLAKEAFNKKWDDLPKKNSFKVYSLLFEDNNLSMYGICGSISTLDYPISNYYSTSLQSLKDKHKEKVKYEEKVGCVWERPFDYDETTVIAVAEYLKSIYDTSKTISKYKDKYNY